MSDYITIQNILQFRVPIDKVVQRELGLSDEDVRRLLCGRAELVKNFSKEIHGKHPKKKPKIDLTTKRSDTIKK